MYRDLMKDLIKWKESPERKPLTIRGARQVGKTWIMKEFGRLYFDNTVYINFDRERRLHDMLEEGLDPKRLITAMGALSGEKIVPEKTLIILDEIQEEPRALSALKYFCEEAPEYVIVSAGSLLGVALHEGTSFPVGKVDILKLYPLSFIEFLMALGKEDIADIIKEKDISLITSMKAILIEELKTYYIVGGMPEAVNCFVNKRDLNEVREVQEHLLDYYRQDFSKHAPVSLVPRLNQVWESIPAQLSKENRKFIYGQIEKGARAKDFELAIKWLSDCGLIHLVNRVKKPGIPLKTYQEMNAFKIYFNDIGLLAALGELPVSAFVDGNELFTEFKGALTEQYVLQQLISVNKVKAYYYSAENSKGEIDFLIQKNNGVYPIEVKSSENLQAKSLKAFAEKYKPGNAIRISMSDYRKQDWMTNLPLYAFTELI